jgi:hypothetical protein
MANVNQVLTLGIGTPADVAHFVLVGLSANDAVSPEATADVIVRVRADDVVVRVGADDYVVRVRPDDSVVLT